MLYYSYQVVNKSGSCIMAEIKLKINDIDCAACVRRLERALGAHSGVFSVQISYASGRAELCYDADKTNIADIVRCVKNAGFRVTTETAFIKCADLAAAEAALKALDCVAHFERDEESGCAKAQFWPVGIDEEYIIQALGMPAEVTIVSSDEDGGGRVKQPAFLRGIFAAIFFSLPQLWDISFAARLIFGALTLLSGAHFFRAAVRAIKKKVLSPDIAAGIILMVMYVLCAVDIIHFLLLTAVTVLLLLSRYAESRAVYALGASVRRLSHMQPKTARILKNGEMTEKSIDELHAGDIISVLPGERIAADGEIVCGECMVDESALTGETGLAQRYMGDTVLCGSLDRAGEMRVIVAHAGKDTVLQRKISELSHAELPRALSVAASALGMTAVFTLIFRGKAAKNENLRN